MEKAWVTQHTHTPKAHGSHCTHTQNACIHTNTNTYNRYNTPKHKHTTGTRHRERERDTHTTGTVVSFNVKKGFGFLRPDDLVSSSFSPLSFLYLSSCFPLAFLFLKKKGFIQNIWTYLNKYIWGFTYLNPVSYYPPVSPVWLFFKF